MKILFNTYYGNSNQIFKAKVKLQPEIQNRLQETYNIDTFYKKGSLYLKNQINKKEFLDEFYKLYNNYDQGKIRLNKKEGNFLADVTMSLDLCNEENLPDKFLKKSIKKLLPRESE